MGTSQTATTCCQDATAGVPEWQLKEWPHRQDLEKGLAIRMRREAHFTAKEKVCLFYITIWQSDFLCVCRK